MMHQDADFGGEAFCIEGALEALLFVSDEPMSEKRLADLLGQGPDEVRGSLNALKERLDRVESGICLQEAAGGWRLFSKPAYHELIERFVLSWDPRKLSRAAYETLAVVAYFQPVTRADVATVRGVNSDSTLSTLLDKGLVCEAGCADAPGNSTLYETTRLFLEHFGLRSVDDLAPLETFAPDDEARAFICKRLSSDGFAGVDAAEKEADDAVRIDESLYPKQGADRLSSADLQDADELPVDFSTMLESARGGLKDGATLLAEALAASAGVVDKIDLDSLEWED